MTTVAVALYNLDGQQVRRIEGSTGATAAFSTTGLTAAGSSLRDLRDFYRKRAADSPEGRGKLNYDATLLVIDALASRTPRDYSKRVESLPVSRVRTRISDDAQGRMRTQTTFAVKEKIVIRTEEVWSEQARNALSHRLETSSASANVSQLDDPPELPCYEYCEIYPGPTGAGAATQGERDAGLAVLAVLYSDAGAANAISDAQTASFDAWWATNYGSFQGAPTAQLNDLINQPRFALFPEALSSTMQPNPCAGYGALRVGAALAYTGLTLFAIAALVNPEPMTKSIMVAWLVSTIGAGVVADGAKIQEENCRVQHGGGWSW